MTDPSRTLVPVLGTQMFGKGRKEGVESGVTNGLRAVLEQVNTLWTRACSYNLMNENASRMDSDSPRARSGPAKLALIA